jgi:hypothetical protein
MRDDVEDLLLTHPSLEDIFLGFYDTAPRGEESSDSGQGPSAAKRQFERVTR